MSSVKQMKTKRIKITKEMRIATLLFALNKDRNDGKSVSFTNLSKAKSSDIDKLYIKYNINFEEEYEAYKINEIEASKLRLENKRMDEEISKMCKEDYYAKKKRDYDSYNELPNGVKSICEKTKQYIDYQNKLKNIYYNKKLAMKTLNAKDINDERIIMKDDEISVIIKGIVIHFSSLEMNQNIYEYSQIKALINDYNTGNLQFKITVKRRNLKILKAIK
jgi:hypothetical protein